MAVHMPSLGRATEWLNSGPLGPDELRGRGEGRYEQCDRILQGLLGVERDLVSVEGLGVEAEADWDHLYTPETYLGSGRGERFASADEAPERLALNHCAVDEEGNGVLVDGRLYQLVREHDGVQERTLEITFREPGAEAYASTFG